MSAQGKFITGPSASRCSAGSPPLLPAGLFSLLSFLIFSLENSTSGYFLSITASGHPHCFFCHLELGSDREVPSRFANHVNVEFSMPTTSASKAAVRSISVEDKPDVRKWVNYSAHYSYKVASGGLRAHVSTSVC